MKTKRLFVAMLAFFPWFSACTNDTRPPKPPLILPFAVQKAGNKVETELRVVEHRGYRFSLRLGFKKGDEEDRRRVRKLAGDFGRDRNGKLIEPGISIPLGLKISVIDSSGERSLLEREILEEEMYAYGSDHYSKQIIEVVLRPGHYRIAIESLKDTPELLGTPVALGIDFNPKTNPIPEENTK